MKNINFNLNSYVKVKLNDKGRNIYYHRNDNLGEEFLRKCPPDYPEEDNDGYTKFQMWELMILYGNHMNFGHDTPFETMWVILDPTL